MPSSREIFSGIKPTSLMSSAMAGRFFTTTTYLWSPLNGLGTFNSFRFSSVQSLSSVWLFATPRNAARQASLPITNSQSLLKLMSIESVMPCNHLIPCHPLLLLPSIFSSIRVCFNESVFHIKQPKFWNFSFSISPSNKYLALISFRIDGFDLLAVQGTLKSLLNTCQNGCHQKEQMLVRM